MLYRVHVQGEFQLMIRYCVVALMVLVSFSASVASATGFLDTSDMCLALKKVNAKAVYLAPIGKCGGKPGRVFVEGKVGDLRDVYVNNKFVGSQPIKTMDINDVSNAFDRADKMGKTLKFEKNPYEKEMQKKAGETKSLYDSPEFRAKLREQGERIKQATIGHRFDAYYSDADRKNDPSNTLDNGERIYIFVSSSMPMETLRNYAADAAALRDNKVSIVLRGFIGGMTKIMPTSNFVFETLKTDPGCQLSAGQSCSVRAVNMEVDPMLFRRYGISRVPAVVYVRGLKTNSPDGSEGNSEHIVQSGEVYRIWGDASLSYILNKLGDAAEVEKLQRMAGRLASSTP